MNRIAGIGLLAVMAIHVAVRPEHGWILLSTCDVAALVTAFGLIAGWHRAIAVACLFEVMVGLPSFMIGVLTTYHLNPTGIIVHLVPPLLGGFVIARHGMPRHAAWIAWCGYILTVVLGYLFAPPVLNVNFASFVWPPLAHVFTVAGSFQAALIVTVGGLLALGELVTRKIVDGRGPATRPAAS